MGSLGFRLKKESLEKELATYQKNHEEVFRKYNREQNPANKNCLKDQLDEYIENIKKIELDIKELEKDYENETIDELIDILKCHFNQYRSNILSAYQIALPNRFIKSSNSQEIGEIINSLLLPPNENMDSYLERFVGFLLLNPTTSKELKIDLKEWARENITNCEKLLQRLQAEKDDKDQKCNPSLMVAISSLRDSYVVEAWLIKNIDRYNREAYSDCEQLKINERTQIPTDTNLNSLPEIIKIFIKESFKECQKYLKQIHVFLPYNLMNHAVDCWHNWGEDEDDNDSTTIGEDYEVIIRCSERLRGKSPPVFKWREKEELLKDSLEQPANNVFILGDSQEEVTLEKELKKREAIAVKIITVFQQQQPGQLLWKSAVPLALWIRQQLEDIDNQSELDRLLNDCCLQELPEKVKHRRLDAMDQQPPENHIGRHICLLWDDPNLLPPEQLLTEITL